MSVRAHLASTSVALALALAAAGCSDEAALAIGALEPPYGPIVGGTMTTLHGRGFEALPGTAPVVLIGGRAAPFVLAIADDELAVLTPPGQGPGDVDVRIVLGERAAGVEAAFRYSAPPTLGEVTPRDVDYQPGTTRVRVLGSGLLAEDARPPTLLVDGQAVTATVESDDALSFVAPGGWPLREPALELVNRRGGATRARSFRYVPGRRPGLLLFADDGLFATYLDPTDLHTIAIPRLPNGFLRPTSVVRDGSGAYWAVDRSRRVGRLDLSEQRIDAPMWPGRSYPTIERVGDGYVAIEINTGRFGRITLPGGEFTPLSPLPPARRGSFGLAYDGTTLWLTSYADDVDQGPAAVPGIPVEPNRIVIRSVDPVTGAMGTPVAIDGPPDLHVEELRALGGRLYASSRSGALVTIDPVTGIATELAVSLAGAHAIAIYE